MASDEGRKIVPLRWTEATETERQDSILAIAVIHILHLFRKI